MGEGGCWHKASEADTVMQFSNKNIITFEAGSLLRNKKPQPQVNLPGSYIKSVVYVTSYQCNLGAQLGVKKLNLKSSFKTQSYM